MNKAFVMLAAPGMIGKSSAAKKASSAYTAISLLENDTLMHEMFRIVRLSNPTEVPINEWSEWRRQVDDKADCAALIRLLHRDWIACHAESPVFVAEGFTYMLSWYRDLVIAGLDALGYGFDYYLLRYEPPIEEQVSRRAKKYAQWNWKETPEFHLKELQKTWVQFEAPVEGQTDYQCVDDASFMRVMGDIMSRQ